MDHSKKTTYLFSIDAMRVIAILGVVMIHTATETLNQSHFNLQQEWFGLFLNQAARFAVPLFFLISGFVLELNHRTLSYFSFFKKRATRILIPYIFWSTLYFLIRHTFADLLSFEFLDELLLGTASYQLYFIPTLIIFYLAFPLFHKILPFLQKKGIFALLVIAQLYFLFDDYYIDTITTLSVFRVTLLSWGMFILGMMASHHKEKILDFSKKHLKLIFIAFLLMLIVVFFNSKIGFETTRKIGFIYSQYHPLNYFYTLTIALLIFGFLETKKTGIKLFMSLSKLSFFVFFVHVFILNYIWLSIGKPFFELYQGSLLTQYWFNPLLFIVVSSLSFAIAYGAHKIPHLSKITG